MHILLVAATHFEIEGVLVALSSDENPQSVYEPEYLVTGSGIFNTAYELGRHIVGKQYDMIINIGIAGAFEKSSEIGSVYNVTSDNFVDFGAENGQDFLSAFEIGLLDANEFPFKNGWIVNDNFPDSPTINSIPEAKGLTVNTTHGNTASIKKLKERISADIESMEGAAFLYICLMNNVPCLQIRATSNYVEKRNRKAWQIPLALDNLSSVVVAILKEFGNLSESERNIKD